MNNTTEDPRSIFQVPENPDPTINGARIIRDYLDLNVVPDVIPNTIMVVGTGGVGIWEKSWSRFARTVPDPGYQDFDEYRNRLAGHLHIGPLRAMCFARTLYIPHFQKAQAIITEAYLHTEEGHQDCQRFEEQIRRIYRQNGAEYQQPETRPETSFDRFIARDPDWEAHYQILREVATDLLELGLHLTMHALLGSDPKMLYLGRKAMNDAPAMFQSAVDRKEDADALIDRFGDLTPSWPGILGSKDTQTNAAKRTQYVAGLAQDATTEYARARPQALDFLALSVTARYAWNISSQNVDYLHQLGAKEGGVPSEMRRVSDHIFRDPDNPILSDTTQTMAQGSTGDLAGCLERMRLTQHAVVATAYAWDQKLNPPVNKQVKKNLRWLKKMLDQGLHPTQLVPEISDKMPENTPARTTNDLLTERIKQNVSRHLTAVYQQPAGHPEEHKPSDMTMYNVRQALELEPLTHRGRITKMVQAADADQEFGAFLSQQHGEEQTR